MEIRLAAWLQNDSIVDGEGIRTVIWTQGCPHNCLGCHNPTTHDFSGGFLVDIDEVVEEIKNLQGQDGITLSGGDPFCQSEACIELCKAAHEVGMNVWCYTGFTYEAILRNKKHRELLNYIDVLVDGKFILEEKSYDLYFRGSRNQRIIDVSESLKKERVVLVEKYIKDKDYSSSYKKPEYMFI